MSRCALCRAKLPPFLAVGDLCADDDACRARRWRRTRWRHYALLCALFLPGGLPMVLLAALLYSVFSAAQRHRHSVASRDEGDSIRSSF